ncbi:MAG: hypothetical protein ABIB47_05005 [Candidatus Woesearchaeota archaeon]
MLPTIIIEEAINIEFSRLLRRLSMSTDILAPAIDKARHMDPNVVKAEYVEIMPNQEVGNNLFIEYAPEPDSNLLIPCGVGFRGVKFHSDTSRNYRIITPKKDYKGFIQNLTEYPRHSTLIIVGSRERSRDIEILLENKLLFI